MAALLVKYGDDVGYGNSIYEYSLPIHKSETYLLTYLKAINVVPLEAEWTVPQKVQDNKISPAPTIANTKERKSNTLRASNDSEELVCSTVGNTGVEYVPVRYILDTKVEEQSIMDFWSDYVELGHELGFEPESDDNGIFLNVSAVQL
ncbi:hypothetical protein BC332_29656 [Capsicum chinense]|nr:hypothetical protein BC332_29656 [Capsicum chinense]